MSACSDTLCPPPHLPPDSPGSAVSSRLQNEYDDILLRAVLIPTSYPDDLTNTNEIPSAVNGRRTPTSRIEKTNIDLIDLNSPTQQHTLENSRIRDGPLNSLLSSMAATSAISMTDQQKRQQQQKENDEKIHIGGCGNSIDQHLARYSELIAVDMETKPLTEKMDHWYLDFKKSLTNEIEKLRLQFLEEAQQTTLREKQKQAKEYIRLNQDIKLMKDMLTKYELTIEQKDQAQTNLNKALNLLYSKTVGYRRYYEWRTTYADKRRQIFTEQLAKRYYEQKLKRQAMLKWKQMTERQWKQRFETACEKKAKDICLEIGNDYELKCTQLELQLVQANDEIARLKQDRDTQDETMKKAFMRGVCALNLEAMSVFLKNTCDGEQQQQNINNNSSVIDQVKRTTSNELLTDNSTVRQYSSDEQPCITTTTDERDTSLNSSHHRPYHSFPTHVYKEFLPSTIYRTGEPHRQQHEQKVGKNKRTSSAGTNENRYIASRKRQNYSSRHPSSGSGNNIVVERHAPINNIRS
ncbi:unnamed protein product [Didymodactylos carnosus]|uniref:Centrosomal protein POC5 n=1 Tax=Didymodactylos carnosus TaxID=1234261 RepID=A0A814H313_9BILA|nr:unnamed protein product [Didymodactylos carnosus]CAF1004472.1 unnamed protein product [Didymodactylos carnosus]CAF3675328.1 unnamed protein product [Didymodactylos carnosus]CAF3775833.1 unnamed protein product [Didymodactylos carnosus]